MLILTIRTDKPEAEVGLYEDTAQLAYVTWQAHRELSNTIHHKIDEILHSQNKTLQDLHGIVCFKGPGSFTGLRIGLTVANSLAYGLNLPITATKGEDWVTEAIRRLVKGQTNEIALPDYGSPPHITLPKH